MWVWHQGLWPVACAANHTIGNTGSQHQGSSWYRPGRLLCCVCCSIGMPITGVLLFNLLECRSLLASVCHDVVGLLLLCHAGLTPSTTPSTSSSASYASRCGRGTGGGAWWAARCCGACAALLASKTLRFKCQGDASECMDQLGMEHMLIVCDKPGTQTQGLQQALPARPQPCSECRDPCVGDPAPAMHELMD